MTVKVCIESVFQRLDDLNEFERRPVSEDQLKGGRYFAGAFAGEHIAATEFVIGVLFVNLGARTFDVIVGLLIGNLLAVLSWTLVCATIAVRTRLTLYWYLRDIVGPAMMAIYSVLNGLLYCILGGAMITVAASAIRIAFGIPEQTRWYPEDAKVRAACARDWRCGCHAFHSGFQAVGPVLDGLLALDVADLCRRQLGHAAVLGRGRSLDRLSSGN